MSTNIPTGRLLRASMLAFMVAGLSVVPTEAQANPPLRHTSRETDKSHVRAGVRHEPHPQEHASIYRDNTSSRQKFQAPPPSQQERYTTKEMLSLYKDEPSGYFPGIEFNPKTKFWRDVPKEEQQVMRLTEVQREAHRVYFDSDGLLRRAWDGELYDTRIPLSNRYLSGTAMFVMDRYGNIYASKDFRRGLFQHSTLSNGEPVAGAGEMDVIEGRIKFINGESGHYKPGEHEMRQVRTELERNGVNGLIAIEGVVGGV
jgi:hypothetical protein